MRPVTWYFDFVSPFACLCLHRLRELPADVALEYRPVLFAGLLNQWGQKGPAEIEAKRRYTYRWCQWQAENLGIPFRFPALHPFNPLHHLRLAIACGCTGESVRRIFEALWTTGTDAADARRFQLLCGELGVAPETLSGSEVKDRLRRNTDDAVTRGVFGVPTFEVDEELFWGADSVDFVRAYLADASVLRNAEMKRLDALPVGAARRS